jgi:glycosyltransferase involved in cell wall biosynthesis
MRVDVIVATYNEPRWLEKCLWGYAVQTHAAFGVIVADDGSGPETAAVVERAASAGLRVRHVWHEDRGYRKCEILNRAIAASDADYLVFTDGDCVPRRDFVEVHAALARPGRFLSGGALRLSREASEAITADDVRTGRFATPRWLRAHGWKAGRKRLRLLPRGRAGALLDALTPTGATWNGGNASTWRSAVVAVNGFDAGLTYGGQDRAFGERLVNAGFRGVQVRHRAVCLHLEHDRPYATPESRLAVRGYRERIRREGMVRAARGLDEMDDPDKEIA